MFASFRSAGSGGGTCGETAKQNYVRLFRKTYLITIYLSSRHDDECAGREGQVVSRIEAVPQCAECECQNRSVLLRHALVDDHAEPEISSDVPVVDAVAEICSQLRI